MAAVDWKFSEKAIMSMAECTAFINIWEGAVRSSKTVASIIAWIDFVEASPHNEFLMTGVTTDTLYRNVIDGATGIINILGKKRARYKSSGQGGAVLELTFGNGKNKVVKKCYCRGAPNEKAENGIRGMTIAGWYADEVTLYPQSFITQAINRMSLDGAQAFWTCNPDSPYHYIKTEFIDKAEEKGYKVFHFELTDNPALPQRYIDNIKKAYSGLWYKRMILGLWVMADGIIYDMFNHETMVLDELPKDVEIMRYWVGVDYGTSNATTFLLIGFGSDKKMYILDEYYHSGRESGRGKSPKMYAQDMFYWLAGLKDKHGNAIKNRIESIFIDPSAEGFILQLYEEGVRNIAQADNAVLRGIELVSSIIGDDRMRVLRKCKNVVKELATYMWDPNKQKIGEDAPVKENDHTMDGIRYVANGSRMIWQALVGIVERRR